MTKTFKNYLEEEMDINVSGGNFLTRITIFLWDKVGFIPKTKSDFEIVVRILNNYVKLSEYLSYNSNSEYWKLEKPNLETVEWIKTKLIPFFSKGLEIPKESLDEDEKLFLLRKLIYECEMMNFVKSKTDSYKEHWKKAQTQLEKLKVVD